MSVIINGKNMGNQSALKCLLGASISSITNSLTQSNIILRKCDLIELVKKQTNKIIKKNIKKDMTDEYKRRLEFYDGFTLFQLINYVDQYDGEFSYMKFKKEFLKFILINIPEIEIELEDMSEGAEYTLVYFFTKIKDIIVDLKDQIDGVNIKISKDSLTKGITLDEVRKLSLFCNIDLPRRIKKVDLQELIMFGLKRRDIKLSIEELNIIEKGSNMKLEELAHNYDIPAKIELSKDGIYEYLLLVNEKQKLNDGQYIEVKTSKYKDIHEKNNNSCHQYKTLKLKNSIFEREFSEIKDEYMQKELMKKIIIDDRIINKSEEVYEEVLFSKEKAVIDAEVKKQKKKKSCNQKDDRCYAVYKYKCGRRNVHEDIMTKIVVKSTLVEDKQTNIIYQGLLNCQYVEDLIKLAKSIFSKTDKNINHLGREIVSLKARVSNVAGKFISSDILDVNDIVDKIEEEFTKQFSILRRLDVKVDEMMLYQNDKRDKARILFIKSQIEKYDYDILDIKNIFEDISFEIEEKQ